MRTQTFAFVLIFLVSSAYADEETTRTQSIPESASVVEIVSTVVERHGGAAAVERWKCGSISFVTTAGILPPGLGPATVTESFDFPNGFLREISAQSPEGPIKMKFAINKAGGRMIADGRDPLPIDRSFADRKLHTFADICNVTQLKDQIPNIQIVKRLEIDGHPTIQLRLNSDKLGSGDYFVDAATGLLTGTSKHAIDPNTGAEATIATRLGAYKRVNGIQTPMKFSATSNGKPMLEVTIKTVAFTDSLAESTFAFPE